MRRCLRERALFDVLSGDGTPAQHAHLRLCAGCAERFDALSDDLGAISGVLAQRPPWRVARRVAWPRQRWVPLGVAAAVLLAVGVATTLLRAPAPVPLALSSASMPAFADDVSAALFASGDDSGSAPSAIDAPYLQAALEAGLPCTQQRIFDGECEDQIFALVLQSD